MAFIQGLKERFAAFRQHPAGKVLTNKYFIVTLVFLVWIIFLDNNNVIRWVRTRQTLSDQYRQIESYSKDIRTTEDKINQLQSQKDSLEAFAREEYFFQEKGEDVYIVEYDEK